MRPALMRFGLVLLSLACAVLIAQQPQANPAATAAKAKEKQQDPGSIRGSVVDTAGQPVAGAYVTLTSYFARQMDQGSAPPDQSLRTGQDGTFTFRNVVPTLYYMQIMSPGFITATKGSIVGMSFPSMEEAPGQLEVKSGETTDLRVALVRQGVILGRVLDGDEGVQGMAVRAARYTYTRGQRVLRTVAEAVTNDLGGYRLPNLEAGPYYVFAEGGRSSNSRPGVSGEIDKLKEMVRPAGRLSEPTAWFPTFYPNVLSIDQAVVVRLPEGGEAPADIHLFRQRVYRVRGVVRGLQGGPAQALVMVLAPGEVPPSAATNENRLPFLTGVTTDPGGKFELRLPSGTFTLAVFGGTHVTLKVGGGSMLPGTGSTPDDGTIELVAVTVGDGDVENVAVSLTASGSIQGVLRVEAGAYADLGLPSQPGGGKGFGGQSPVPEFVPVDRQVTTGLDMGGRDAEGRFAVSDVPAGRYKLDWRRIPDGYYVKSVRLDGADVGNSTLETRGSEAALEITFAKGAPKVSATVTNAKGEMDDNAVVILWPKVRNELSTLGGVVNVTDKSVTLFRANPMAPGEYYAAAFPPLKEGGVYGYRPFLERFNGDATTVKLEANASVTLTLTTVSASKVKAELEKLR